MSVDLSTNFAQFLANISLGEPQISRMNSAAQTVSEFLVRSYGMQEANVFLQGSYANGTAIEPIDEGEYDIDLVAVCVAGTLEATAALNDLEQRFRADGRFRDRIRRKKPCVRLEYAGDDVGSFHVDIVPTRPTGTDTAPLEAPRRSEGWKQTAPSEYTNWCQQQGILYMHTVKMLKRWRTVQQPVRTAIKSIVLQVLIAECMPQVIDDAARIAATFHALRAKLGGLSIPPIVRNPVLLSENLAASWSTESFESFKRELLEASEFAEQALGASDPIEAADIWRELLGEDFPSTTPDELGFQVGDITHAQTPAERGWSKELTPRYSARIEATMQRGKRGQNRRAYMSRSVVFAPNRLRFKAHIKAPNHVSVWWQVANTGAHARESGGLRGEIFKGRDFNNKQLSDQTENCESTKYTGSHLIRTLLVRSDRVVAKSPWFIVNIYAKGRPFRL